MQIVASMSDEKSPEKQTDDHACNNNSPNLTLTTDQTICTHRQSPGAEPNHSPSNMPPAESIKEICTTPNTDNLLDISVPKITLLGKEQAKKRLYAFSASKQSISPNCKRNKSKEDEKTDNDKMEPAKKCKKRLNPTEKAKAVIEEIEEIKKMEHARSYYGSAEQQTKIDARSRSNNEWKSRHRKEHRRSKSDEKVRLRSKETTRYPVRWSEIRGCDQETADGKVAKKIEECLDFRRQFLFETPSLLLHPFTFKDVSGKEKIVPILSRRTTKTRPAISFSVTEKVETTPFNRKSVIDYVTKPYRDNILKIINSSARPLEKITSKSTTRKWYPQKSFSSIEKETECTVLENSLSLSFLQNYSDEEEQDKDDSRLSEKGDVKGLSKTETPQQKKPKQSKHKHKSKKMKKKKEKTEKTKKKLRDKSHKIKKSEETDWVERPETKPPKVEVHSEAHKPKRNASKEKQTNKTKTPNKITSTEKVAIQDDSRSAEVTVRKRKHKRSSDRHSSSQKQDKLEKKEQSPIPEKKRKEEVSKKIPPPGKDNLKEVKKDSSDKPPVEESKETVADNAKCPAERELNTPDTDEYYSKWESDDELLNSSTSKQSDLYTDTSGINVSWESDADIPLCKSPVREFYKAESPHKAVVEDFSPFRNRFINDRRRSRCSLDNPSPPYLEMPLNIRNYRDIQWEAERLNSDRINFRLENEQKCYSLYTEDSWEKDDYMTIKSEGMRLAEDRRSLMEERRQFEIEKRNLEELERERYYLRRSNVEENYNESYQSSEDRYRHKSYHFEKEGEFDRSSRKSSCEILPKSVEHGERRASSDKRKRSRWQSIDLNELESGKVEVSKSDLASIKRNKVIGKDEKAKPEVLENEYEKFLKALNSQTKSAILSEKKSRSETKKKSKKVSSSSSSSSSSDDSDSSSSATSSSSNSEQKKAKKKPLPKKPNVYSVKKIKPKPVFKIEDVERDLFEKQKVDVLEIPLPQVEILQKPQDKIIPLPVPSPKVDSAVLNSTPSIADQISVMATIAASPIKHDISKEKTEIKDSPKTDNAILIKYDAPKLKKLVNQASVTDIALSQLETKKTNSPLMAVSKKSEMNDFNLNDNISVKNEEEVTTTEIVEHNLLTNQQDGEETISITPKRNSPSHSKRREKNLIKRNEGPTNGTESSAKPIISLRPKEGRKKGENISPASETYRKLTSHELDHFSIKKCSKTTKERMSSVEKSNNFLKQSPLSSPLDGFKCSVADSTISDEQLLQSNLVECTESPNLYKSAGEKSPRRMSLDERINQALGLSEEPKPIATTYSNDANYESQYYSEGFDSYVEEPRKPDTLNKPNQRSLNQNSKPKVLQVGNILQVVPTEDYSEAPAPPKRKTLLQQNKISNSTQKILQVGNMLQIVPTTSFPDSFELDPEPEPEIDTPPVPSTSTPIKSTFNAEMLIKQKAERRAEKDKRKQERQLKRKEKEKKRKERERRKQLKVKLQTEASIKQALILEDAHLSDEQQSNEPQKPVQWPPIPQIVSNSAYRPSGKGILSQKREDREELFDKRKQVLFSDGIRPGEGTSPSGGEELSSPPPAPRKLPKEKRFKKIKLPKKEKAPKKKKVKVKVIRQSQFDEESEEDTLPPPPPPPGSPPPHIFPSRIKDTIFNNIHPNLLASITNPPIQTPDTSYPPPVYRPNAPVVVPLHIPLHPPGPPPQVHRHHLPALPMLHHGSFNQSPSIIPHGNHR